MRIVPELVLWITNEAGLLLEDRPSNARMTTFLCLYIQANISYRDPTTAVTGNISDFHWAVTGKITDFYILILQGNATCTLLKREYQMVLPNSWISMQIYVPVTTITRAESKEKHSYHKLLSPSWVPGNWQLPGGALALWTIEKFISNSCFLPLLISNSWICIS